MSCSNREILKPLLIAALTTATLLFGSLAFAANESYSYDAQGRLLSVTYGDLSTATYTYDSAGNRTVVVTATP